MTTKNRNDPNPLPKAVHVWPYLVRVEMLVAILAMLVLMVWSIVLDAPLQQAADPNWTPNPSKAPWYFVGLQELLVYFDPWIAGVLVPALAIFGLAAIPYLDVNEKGNGYYTVRERPFAVGTFLFGFLMLWVLLIAVGVFLRGPGWSFYFPWESWDALKVQRLTDVNLWEVAERRSPTLGAILGGATVGLYFLLPSVGFFWWKRRQNSEALAKLGLVRYCIIAFLFLAMMLLPIKMILRWIFNLHYIWVWPGVLNV